MICFFLLLALGLPSFLAAREGGNERVRREAVAAILQSRSIPFDDRPLMASYGGFNRSIHVALSPGESPGDRGLFMLAVPLSAAREREGLSFGIETALAFIEKVRERGADREILVAFLGDEVSLLPRELERNGHAGLRDLCALPEIPEDAALWYLDMEEAPGRLLILHGTEKSIAPLSLMEKLPELSARHGVPYALGVRFNEIYKLGLAEDNPALDIARLRGINALYAAGGEGGGGGISAGMMAELLADYAGSLDLGTENLDTHYSIVALGEKTRFISEGATVALLFLGAACFLFFQSAYSLLRRRIIRLRHAIFLRYSWLIPLLLGCLTAALIGGGVCFSLLCRLFKLPPSPSYRAAALTFIFAMMIFSMGNLLLDRIRIPRKELFYGRSALLLVGAGIFIAAALNITFVPVFVWAFLFTLLGSLVKRPLLVYASALTTPLLALGALFNIMERGNRKLGVSFLEGDFFVCFYIALACLPFVLLIKRGRVLGRKHRKRPLLRSLLPRLLFSSLSLLLLVLHTGKLAENRSPPPVRRLVPPGESSLTLSFADRVFLESRILELKIEAPGEPVRFDLLLENGADGGRAEIYSASMPVEGGGGDSLRFILGEDPPNPFTAELVLSPDFSGTIRAEALYTRWDAAVDPLPAPEGDDYVLRLAAVLDLEAVPPR